MKPSAMPEDGGFRHGRGVFETIRISKGKVLFAKEHWELLVKGATALGLDPSKHQMPAKVPAKEGVWRWFLTPGKLYDMWQDKVPAPLESCRLYLSDLRLSSLSWEARFKTLSYLTRLQARAGLAPDEAVLLNEHGMVTGASMANLFWLKDGVLFTSSPDAGCREGVVRGWVLANAGISVRQGLFPLEALENADEIFLTNSLVGITPVSQWREKAMPPVVFAEGLRARYRQAMGLD